MNRPAFAAVVLALSFLGQRSAFAADSSGVEFPGPEPGRASGAIRADTITLENRVIRMSWKIVGGRLAAGSIGNRLTNLTLDQSDTRLFRIALATSPGREVKASEFSVSGSPRIAHFDGIQNGVRIVDRIAGESVDVDLVSDSAAMLADTGPIHAHWHVELRDGSNYIREVLTLSAEKGPVGLSRAELLDLRLPNAMPVGTSPGSPVAGSGFFCGVELPGALSKLENGAVSMGFDCKLSLSPAQSYTFGSVIGVAPEGQLRRSFLYYIERERARPSSPFLHYNCWYDLGLNVSQPTLLDAVSQIDNELTKKRGVPVQSYLVDDGWDDPSKGLWTENRAKFPDGFAGLKRDMAKSDARMAIWISPLGGYGGAEERTARAREMGLIPPDGSLDLANPAYKKWFQERCLTLMRDDGVNAFKWDRAGDGVSPHFMALLDIAHNLRQQDPNVFINVTVGTWPSPFWLNHVDSTWRNGSGDVGWAGKGDDREQWITFRDGNCHRLFVEKGPLYPLNSVMHHGLVLGREFQAVRVSKAGANLRNDTRAYFANGTMLQELYLTPSMMTPEAWDQVAEAARWAHANADVLVDSHWVGGDPLKLEPYGYAAWNRRKGTFMLRNPDDQPRTITLDAATVFDLPEGAPRRYALHSPYTDQHLQTLTLEAGKPETVTLNPFEVLVFDANPL